MVNEKLYKFSLLKNYFLLFFVLFSSAAMAQTVVKGRITNNKNQPLEGVSIVLLPGGISAVTNSSGEYELKNLKPGHYTLKVSAIDYEHQHLRLVADAGRVLTFNIVLTSKQNELQEVTISSAAKKFAEKKSEYVARMPLKNLENAQVYTVVPKELFVEQLSTDLKSALQTVPGLANITQGVGSGGIGLSIRMRGFSGTNAGGAIRNGMATNWVSLSDPVNLEAIEVIKGPSGALFGGVLVSYGGLVNRVTKKPFTTTGGRIDYSTGSFGLSRLSADVNTPLNKDQSLLFRVNAAYDNQRTFQDFGKSITQVVAPALTYKVNDKLTLDFDFELFKTQRNTTYIGSINTSAVKLSGFDDLDIDFSRSFTNNDLLSTARIFNGFAKAEYKISDKWKSTTNYSYANTENNANYMFLALTADTTFSRRLMNIPATFGISQIQQNFNGDVKIGPFRNRILVGLDYMMLTTTDRRTGQISVDAIATNKEAPDISVEKYQQSLASATRTVNKRNFQTYSAYASDVINITDALLGMASVRVDYYKSKYDNYDQTSWSPKLGLVYQVLKDKVSLFGNYMNGFANVSPGTGNAAGDIVIFKPEHANQLEGGLKVEVLNGKLNGTLSYYDIEVEDKLRTVTENGVSYSVQDATERHKGVDADLIANPFKGMHIILGYGYNDSRYTKANTLIEGLRVTSAPKHTANTWVSYKFTDGSVRGLGFGFGGNYQSDSYFVNTRLSTGTLYQFKVSGYTRLDGTVFYEQTKYRFGLKLNNITNKKYWTTDAYAFREPTRQFVANLSYKF